MKCVKCMTNEGHIDRVHHRFDHYETSPVQNY